MRGNGGVRVTAKRKALTGEILAKATRASIPAARAEGEATMNVDEAASKPVHNYKRHTKKLISERFPNIMKSMADKSEEGSLAHTKFLFEIGGVNEDLQRQGRGKEELSLGDLLLAEVRRQHAEKASRLKEPLESDKGPALLTSGNTNQGDED